VARSAEQPTSSKLIQPCPAVSEPETALLVGLTVSP